MPEHPPVALVAMLTHYGLTSEVLEEMVHFCETAHSGSVTLHYHERRFQVLEIQSKTRMAPQPQQQLFLTPDQDHA
jgi:hypothetical protein